MDWKEYKEQRVRGELEWILEELNRFMKEKGEYIIENLLGVIPDCINELDKVKYQLWVYKTKTDSWRHVITSLSQESLEKQIKDKKFREVLRIEESAPYLIIPETGKSNMV